MKLAPEDGERSSATARKLTSPIEQVRKGDVFVVRPGESIPVDGRRAGRRERRQRSGADRRERPGGQGRGRQCVRGDGQSAPASCAARRPASARTPRSARSSAWSPTRRRRKRRLPRWRTRSSGVFVPAVISIAAGDDDRLAAAWPGRSALRCAARHFRAGHQLPVRAGAGDAGRHHGRQRRGREERHPVQDGGIVWRRPARMQHCRAGQDRHHHAAASREVTDRASGGRRRRSRNLLHAAVCAGKPRASIRWPQAIVQYAAEQRRKLQPECGGDFAALPGNGLTANEMVRAAAWRQREVHGSGSCNVPRKPCKRRQKRSPADGQNAAAVQPQDGSDSRHDRRGGRHQGRTAREAVAELRDMGIRVVMLTGDNPAHGTRPSAQPAGVDEVVAGVLPDGKEDVVRQLAEGTGASPWSATASTTPRRSPRADVGIAIGAGTDVAMDAADVVLMKSTPLRRSRRHPPQPRDAAQHPREPLLGVSSTTSSASRWRRACSSACWAGR